MGAATLDVVVVVPVIAGWALFTTKPSGLELPQLPTVSAEDAAASATEAVVRARRAEPGRAKGRGFFIFREQVGKWAAGHTLFPGVRYRLSARQTRAANLDGTQARGSQCSE